MKGSTSLDSIIAWLNQRKKQGEKVERIGLSLDKYQLLCQELKRSSVNTIKGIPVTIVVWPRGKSPTQKAQARKHYARRKIQTRRHRHF